MLSLSLSMLLSAEVLSTPIAPHISRSQTTRGLFRAKQPLDWKISDSYVCNHIDQRTEDAVAAVPALIPGVVPQIMCTPVVVFGGYGSRSLRRKHDFPLYLFLCPSLSLRVCLHPSPRLSLPVLSERRAPLV